MQILWFLCGRFGCGSGSFLCCLLFFLAKRPMLGPSLRAKSATTEEKKKTLLFFQQARVDNHVVEQKQTVFCSDNHN